MKPQIGRHFLQVPGPTNVPDRVLRALSRPTIDPRGPQFADLMEQAIEGMRGIFQTSDPIVIFPSSGSGAGEAAMVNLLSPGDRVLMFDNGFFAGLWRDIAGRLGLEVEFVPGDWRRAIDPESVEDRLRADRDGRIRAVMVVHNETSTGVTHDIARIRAAIDAAGHPALFIVDAVSSIGSMEYRHDEWRVDVTITGSQKGLMLPPGIGFNAVSAKALAASQGAGLPRAYWDWRTILETNDHGFYPYTPAMNLFYGLLEAIELFREEGLPAVFARHERHAAATRAAVERWGFEICAIEPDCRSNSLTAILFDSGIDADHLRQVVLQRFDLSLGGGLGTMNGRLIRIGHLGHLNDLMLAGTLCGLQMGLELEGLAHDPAGLGAALEYLARQPAG